MTTEIERKWLIRGDAPIDRAVRSTEIRQGYLTTGEDGAEVRVRVSTTRWPGGPVDDPDAVVTVKRLAAVQPIGGPTVRDEQTWHVGLEMGEQLLAACRWKLTKIRHLILADPTDPGGHCWEVDVYTDTPHDAQGRLPQPVVELELYAVDAPLPPLPRWVGEEVTGRPDYSNRAIAMGGAVAPLVDYHRAAIERLGGMPVDIVVRGTSVPASARDTVAVLAAIDAERVSPRRCPGPQSFRTGEDYRDHLPCGVCEPRAAAGLPSDTNASSALPPGYVRTPHGAARLVAQAPPPRRDADAVVDLGEGPDGKPRQVAVSGGPGADLDEAELDVFEVNESAPPGERPLQPLRVAPMTGDHGDLVPVGPNAEPPGEIKPDGTLVWDVG